jgi:hypothetical protein
MRLFPLWMCGFLGLLCVVCVYRAWWWLAVFFFLGMVLWIGNEVCERLRAR